MLYNMVENRPLTVVSELKVLINLTKVLERSWKSPYFWSAQMCGNPEWGDDVIIIISWLELEWYWQWTVSHDSLVLWQGTSNILTHWGRETHTCISKLSIIGSDNGLSPGRRQTIIWTNAGILSIGPIGTILNEILIIIHTFSFKKIHFKMSSGKWRPFCLGLSVLTYPSTLLDYFKNTILWLKYIHSNIIVKCQLQDGRHFVQTSGSVTIQNQCSWLA